MLLLPNVLLGFRRGQVRECKQGSLGSDAGCCSSPEPLGQARGTQAEPKRNPRRVLVRRCFRVEEPKGGNRNPGRNPARLLVRLGLRGRAPLRGIYYYYRGGRAPQGATRRCAPALYRGPGPKRVASQSCLVVFRTCLNQTGPNSTRHGPGGRFRPSNYEHLDKTPFTRA